MGTVVAVCIREKDHAESRRIEQASVGKDFGLSGDRRSGKQGLQVSILTYERLLELQGGEGEPAYGSYGENLVIQGEEFKNLKIGDELVSNDILLKVRSIGCPENAKGKRADTLMAKEGIFCRVIFGGIITEGDVILLN